jgi:hypothetical protein
MANGDRRLGTGDRKPVKYPGQATIGIRSQKKRTETNKIALVAADMIKAPFVVGARVNRTLVLFTTEHNITRVGFQSVKSGKMRRFCAASGKW